MKQRMRNTQRVSRALFAVMATLAIICLTALGVSAANTLDDVSMTYDFSTYTSNNDAILNGWALEGEAPSGTTKTGIISVSGGFVGASDYATREGYGVYENLSIVYTVPTESRIALADYDVIRFTRKLVNAEDFLVSGARYAVILKTDAGDVIRFENEWIAPGVTNDELEIVVELQDEFEALSSDALLESITFMPYVNTDDFRPDTAAENQLLVQFLVGRVVFAKAVDMPIVDTVADAYDELETTEHTGKITGLVPEYTYEYKLTYDTSWTTVSGVSEITGLYGAGYLIRRVADESAGLLASEAVAVNVPKALSGGVSYSKEQVSAGEFSSLITMTPTIGYWTSGNNRVYNAAGRLTIGTNYSYLQGIASYDQTQSPIEGAYFRRNVQKLEYTLKPEEQIEFSNAALDFAIYCSGTFPYLSYQEVTGVMKIWVAGHDEPLVVRNLRHAAGDNYYSYNLRNTFPDVEGYIERIEYYPFYNQDSMACYINNYPQISAFFISEIYAAPTPSVFTIDMEDGTYKISGLKATVQYEISYDEGATWEELPEEINYIDGIIEGTYYIRQAADSYYFASEPAIIVIKARRAAPDGLSVSGTSIIGLDTGVTYEYAPYSIAGDMEFTQVTGVSSIDSLTPGLWAVRFVEDSDNFAGNMGFYMIEGSTTKGNVNIAAQDKTSANRGFVTGEICSDVLPISFYNNTNTPSASLVMYNGWKKTTDMSINETLNVTYAFEYHQAFDIKELYQFYYKAGFQGSGLYLNSGSLAGFYNKIRFYVAGSDVEYYDVYNPWTTTGKTTFNAGAALPADAHGYVVGYKFYYYGMWPEISGTMKSGTPYPLYTIYDLTLGTKVATPAPSVQYNASGEFTISGLDSNYSHGYSSDGKTFINLAKGTTSFNVKAAGTYYVYAENTSGMKSEIAVVEAHVDGSAAVTGLTVTGNTIEGFNENLLYEYRKYSFTTPAEYTALAQGTTSLENLEAGLWEIRYVTEDGDGKPGYYVVYGEKNGTISLNALYYAGGDTWDGSKSWVQGRWTNSNAACYLDSTGSATAIRLATNWKGSLEQEALDAFYFMYQFTDDEIVPVTDVLPISFVVGFGGGWAFSNPSTTRIRYHVVGSDVEYYDVLAVNTKQGAQTTADLLASNPNAKGYVVAIQIWPFASFPEGTTLADTNNHYPVLRIVGEATGETDPRLLTRINVAQVRPQGLKLERVDANLYQLYKITGLEADALYEYSYDNTNWIALEAGTTEIGPVVGGKYWVRYAATETSDASESVLITTPAMTPAFISGDVSLYPYEVSQNLVSGMWSTYPNTFGTLTTTPTSYIGANVALNTVRYAYTFSPEHQFSVNEYPIFAIDFNNELYNMGISVGYISGAVAAVDIYFVGSNDPYTVTGEWGGYHPTSTGATANRILVDLLSLDPELGGKTVRAFVIRPYSNVSLSPSGYNTSSTASHYVYFRLLNAGFYSTMQNVEAIYSDTHEAVNSFDGIVLENVPSTAVTGSTISIDDLAVLAYYSDGTEEVIDNSLVTFDIPAFDAPGIYTVSASYRGIKSEVSVVVDIATDSVELYTLPEKTVYYVGQMFNPEGISFKYITSDGTTVVTDSDYTVASILFEAEGTYTIDVHFCGLTFMFEVTVLPESAAIKMADESTLTFDSDRKKLEGLEEKTTVSELLANFSSDVAVFNLAGANVTEALDTIVGTGFRVVTLVEGAVADYADVIVTGDVNGNGRIDTNDYVLIKRAYINTIVIPEGSDVFTAADVNGNGTIDTNDYLKIKNHYRGILNLFN